MYTVEYESNASIITSLDKHDAYHDVEVIICDDDTVFIRQYNLDTDEMDTIFMSYDQLLDIRAGLDSSEGAFMLVRREDDTP
jgi:hypothetical protein